MIRENSRPRTLSGCISRAPYEAGGDHMSMIPFRLAGAASVLLVTLLLCARADDAGGKYALLVGVTKYKGNGFRDLKYCENDVEELATALVKAGFERKNVRVLTNARGAKD